MHKGFGVWLLLLLMLMSNGAAAKVDKVLGPYLDATIDNRNPYVGQEVLLTYSLYFSSTAPRIVDTGKAEHPGIWAQEVTPEGYIRSIEVKQGGQRLRKAVIKQLKLVPMQAGMLSISNYRIKCFLPQDNGTGTDSGPDVESVITAPTSTITAKPLPKGAPAGFNGAVGDFSIGLAAERYQVRAGEPLTISAKISGRGNLKAFPQVVLDLPKGFRQVDSGVPTVTREDAGAADEAMHSRMVLVSDLTGDFRFAPVRMIAFNPWKGLYETVSSGQVTITVLPQGKPSAAAAPESTPDATTTSRTGWIPPTLMIFMAAAFLLLIVILFLVSKKQQKRPAPVSEKLPAPPSAPREPSKIESPEILKQRIYDALGKSGIKKPAGLTSHQLRKELKGQKVEPECAEALIEVMEMIDRAVYTPGTTSGDALEKLNRKAASVLELLQGQCIR
jgi:hypothetical protein